MARHDGWRDVVEGAAGAAVMTAALLTPFLLSRLQFGPAIVEPVSFAMDRRMLIGIKQRAERA